MEGDGRWPGVFGDAEARSRRMATKPAQVGHERQREERIVWWVEDCKVSVGLFSTLSLST
jgi:hypothetical protein